MEFSFDIVKILQTFGVFIVTFIILYLGKVWYSYRFFKNKGIKTPDYEFFFGNFRQLRKNRNYSEVLRDWTKIYGKTYGFYEGHLPVLVTSDLDLIQEIFVKQSTNFSARKKNFMELKEGDPNHSLFTSTKSRWKRMRTVMNPTFSSAKLRELSPLLVKCTDRFLEILENQKENKIQISSYLKRFTMDSIWNCAFGIDTDLQFNKENDYFNKCEAIFARSVNLDYPSTLGAYIHEIRVHILSTLLLLFNLITKFVNADILHPIFWLNDKVMDIVDKRKSENIRKKDYLQLLLDAESDQQTDTTNKDSIDYRVNYLDKKITTSEIKQNLSLFMLAGYETSSTALNYCCFILVRHPEEQQTLYEEIVSHFEDETTIDSDSVQKLEYLDMFLKETLRHYPIGNSVVGRRCTNPTTINGIDIPYDMSIVVDVLSLHFDPEIWGPVDPNIFYPRRFSKDIKRNPLGFMSFGNGPRNCIGMKFALIEMKIALVKLLFKYELLPTESTPSKLEFFEGAVRHPKNDIIVCLKKRNNQ